jgi:hypothetical protein
MRPQRKRRRGEKDDATAKKDEAAKTRWRRTRKLKKPTAWKMIEAENQAASTTSAKEERPGKR